MELCFFGRFHVHAGEERAFEEALREVLDPSRDEEGCMSIHAFRGVGDRRVFYIHSRWRDEKAFDTHAQLPHTVEFLARAQELVEEAIEMMRTEEIG
jgi:quinol monooxygenase YgiN